MHHHHQAAVTIAMFLRFLHGLEGGWQISARGGGRTMIRPEAEPRAGSLSSRRQGPKFVSCPTAHVENRFLTGLRLSFSLKNEKKTIDKVRLTTRYLEDTFSARCIGRVFVTRPANQNKPPISRKICAFLCNFFCQIRVVRGHLFGPINRAGIF